MHIILVGCGRVGASLATALAADEHDVVVIDKDPAAFANLGSAFNGVTVTGPGIDTETLRQAGITKADAFAAVTSFDNVNLMASQMAKQIFGVAKVIARVNDPRKRDAYDQFAVETISPTDLGASQLRRMIETRGLRVLNSMGAGEVVTVRLIATAAMAGRSADDLERPEKLRVICIERGDSALIPGPAEVLAVGDMLLLAARRDALDWLRALSGEVSVR
jgi:trk system potassium uptake protein TrkA